MKCVWSMRLTPTMLPLLLFISAAVHAQNGGAISGEIPMEEILDPQGMVNMRPGLEGRIDHDGWQMTLGPNGEPRFRKHSDSVSTRTRAAVQSSHGDKIWSDRFGIAGVAGAIDCILIHDEDIYIGGDFSFVNNIPVDKIARWDGSQWHPVGEGLDGWVVTMEIVGDDIYVGGNFTIASAGAMHIARWNMATQTWHSVGGGTNNTVSAIRVVGSDVYVGGSFTTAGEETVNRIARWNGTTWSALGDGLNNSVSSILIAGSDLYAGGTFTRDGADTEDLRRIAKWNGTAWSEVGGGVNGMVRVLAADDDGNIYMGGNFTEVNIAGGGEPMNRIAVWDGDAWSALAGGVNAGVFDILISEERVYIAGEFTTAGILDIIGVAEWNGENWSGVGDGVDRYVYSLADTGDFLYVGGYFIRAGAEFLGSLARYNGEWSAVGTTNGNEGAMYQVYAIAVSGRDVYIGGWFGSIGGIAANNIVRWDGEVWHPLGNGVRWESEWWNAWVEAIDIADGNVYAGGGFDTAGEIEAHHIARYNTSTQTWHALGSGTNNYVYALQTVGSNVYAGGVFTFAGGEPVNRIARWNGSEWSSLAGGLNSNVNTMLVLGSELYVGGSFTRDAADTKDLRRIAKWDGAVWSEVGGGVNNTVSALAADGSALYAGGVFTSVNIAGGGESMNRIAMWGGSGWTALGGGVNAQVYDIHVVDGEVIVAGSFTSAGIFDLHRLAKWNGFAWSGFGSGFDNPVYTVTSYGDDILAGGWFTSAGNTSSVGFARWGSAPDDPPTDVAEGEHTIPESFRLEQNYPNPFNPATVIRYSIPERSSVRLTIHNTLGQRVANPVNGAVVEAGFHEYQWSPSLPSGIYFYRLEATPLDNSRAPFVDIRKMILMK
jgi:hypothetical protein